MLCNTFLKVKVVCPRERIIKTQEKKLTSSRKFLKLTRITKLLLGVI